MSPAVSLTLPHRVLFLHRLSIRFQNGCSPSCYRTCALRSQASLARSSATMSAQTARSSLALLGQRLPAVTTCDTVYQLAQGPTLPSILAKASLLTAAKGSYGYARIRLPYGSYCLSSSPQNMRLPLVDAWNFNYSGPAYSNWAACSLRRPHMLAQSQPTSYSPDTGGDYGPQP